MFLSSYPDLLLAAGFKHIQMGSLFDIASDISWRQKNLWFRGESIMSELIGRTVARCLEVANLS